MSTQRRRKSTLGPSSGRGQAEGAEPKSTHDRVGISFSLLHRCQKTAGFSEDTQQKIARCIVPLRLIATNRTILVLIDEQRPHSPLMTEQSNI